MKTLLAFAALLIIGSAAHAQTASRIFSCPTTVLPSGAPDSTGVIGANAKTHAACPTWSWTAQSGTTAIRRDAALPLVAVCTTSCGWGPNNTVRWKRPNQVTDAERIAVCTGTQAGDNCSPQSFSPSSILTPATSTPVDCEVSAWGACSITTGQETRTVTRQPANGGAACPALTRPCEVPLPISYTFGINRNPIVAGETATVTWSTVNAVTCTLVDGPNAQVVALSGSKVIGPYTPQAREIVLSCSNFFGAYNPTVHLVVTEPEPIYPSCWPHWADWIPRWAGGTGHVGWAKLTTSNANGWDVKATFFCPRAGGQPKRYTYALNSSKLIDEGETEFNGGRYDENVARAECEATCVNLEQGSPVDVELDAWGQVPANSIEQLGVIE